jgi:hypothetical protein
VIGTGRLFNRIVVGVGNCVRDIISSMRLLGDGLRDPSSLAQAPMTLVQFEGLKSAACNASPNFCSRHIVQEISVIDFALNRFIGLDHGEKMDLEGPLLLYVGKMPSCLFFVGISKSVTSYPGSKRTAI